MNTFGLSPRLNCEQEHALSYHGTLRIGKRDCEDTKLCECMEGKVKKEEVH